MSDEVDGVFDERVVLLTSRIDLADVERLSPNEAAIVAVCAAAVAANAKQADAYRAGKHALLGFFVGVVMKETRGSANPQKVNATLLRLLGVS